MNATNEIIDSQRGSLFGLTALVTGGSRNIGAAICRQLARCGADIAIVAQSNSDELAGVIQDVAAFGRTASAFVCDIEHVASIELMLASVTDQFGAPDIVVNCAASRPRVNLEEITEQEWDSVMNVNVKAQFWVAKSVIPHMRAKQFGRIINIGGIDAYWGQEGRTHVTTSKSAITGLTRSLAYSVAQDGITVNEVVPGVIDTERRHAEWYGDSLQEFYKRVVQVIPAGRLGTVSEVAAAVAFLASRDSSYITGQSLFVSGGAFPLARAL